MKKEVGIVIGNAVIWGAVIIGCSWALRDTGDYQKIQFTLAAGAIASLFLVGMTTIKPKAKG